MIPPEHDNDTPANSGGELVEGSVDDEDIDGMFAGLSFRQTNAVMALMSETTIERAASRAGIKPRTLHRWLKEPEFMRAYRLARRQAFQHATAIVVKYAPVAVSTLVRILSDRNAPPNAQVTAAGLLLRFGRESIQLDEVMSRIDEIEAAVRASQKSTKTSNWDSPNYRRPLP